MSKQSKRKFDERCNNRPNQAAPGEPHWIVMCLSRHHEAPEERRRALFFRHKTAAEANAEAARLAKQFPGQRFAVYGSGPSFKIEAEKVAEDIAA